MDHLLSRLTAQLDSLIPFLAAAEEEVFAVIWSMHFLWSEENRHAMPESLSAFRTNVAHGAFLLGYAYIEAFVTDLIWHIYERRRDLLPPDKTVKFRDVLLSGDYNRLVTGMIDSTLGAMNSLERKIHHLEHNIGLKSTHYEGLLDAHVIRNALIHNSGRINREVPANTRWRHGEQIQLSVHDVNVFGVLARDYAEEIVQKANRLCSGS